MPCQSHALPISRLGLPIKESRKPHRRTRFQENNFINNYFAEETPQIGKFRSFILAMDHRLSKPPTQDDHTNPIRVQTNMALDRRHRSLSMVLDEHAFYVRFSGLPDLCFKIDEFEGLHYHYATGLEADKIRMWGLTTQLDHRLKNAANGRTALVATDKGFELRG